MRVSFPSCGSQQSGGWGGRRSGVLIGVGVGGVSTSTARVGLSRARVQGIVFSLLLRSPRALMGVTRNL